MQETLNLVSNILIIVGSVGYKLFLCNVSAGRINLCFDLDAYAKMGTIYLYQALDDLLTKSHCFSNLHAMALSIRKEIFTVRCAIISPCDSSLAELSFHVQVARTK